jgi:hypothetical protein
MAAANATGEARTGPLWLQFGRSVTLAFGGSSISADGGLLLHRELDGALGLTDAAAWLIGDPRTGRNARYAVCQLAKAALPRDFFAGAPGLINGPRGRPVEAACA